MGIESQPLVEGWSTNFGNLLGDDFGNGHSIALLADSLALQRAMHRLDSSFTPESFIPILVAATHRVPNNFGNADYEVDALENVLDGLRRLLVDPGLGRTPFKEGASGFGDIGSRESFHANLESMVGSAAFQGLAGRVTISASNGDLADSARHSFVALATLITLSPVTISATDAASQQALDNALASAWAETYAQWQADRDLSAGDREAGLEHFTDQWIADRSSLLSTMAASNVHNNRDIGISASLPPSHSFEFRYTDPWTGVQRILLGENTARPGGVLVPVPMQLVQFGDGLGDTIAGTDNQLGDHLYGGGGADVLNGLGGGDHLEGNAGEDTLAGGEGADMLLGGTDADTLRGDAGNDTLVGGEGLDVYDIAAESGQDTVIDSDGGAASGWPGGRSWATVNCGPTPAPRRCGGTTAMKAIPSSTAWTAPAATSASPATAARWWSAATSPATWASLSPRRDPSPSPWRRATPST